MKTAHPLMPDRPGYPGRMRHRGPERGFALILALFTLVVVALLTVSMFRSFGLQGRLAGNTLEKQRSLQAADNALQYAEWWIRQGNAGTGSSCTTLYNANNLNNMQTCSTVLTPAAAMTLPWTVGGTYVPPSMTVQAGGGLNTSGTGISGDVNYSAMPTLYVAYLGLGTDGRSAMYQVTAAGYGGSTATNTVVQSVYSVSSKINNIGNP